MTLLDSIRWQCLHGSYRTALSVPGPYRDSVSYGRLIRFVHSMILKLDAVGVAPGSLWVLHFQDSLLHIVTMLALEALGGASLGWTSSMNGAGWDLAGILTDRPNTDDPKAYSNDCPVHHVDLKWMQQDGHFDYNKERAGRGANDLSRIILTSGSTGAPKGVGFTHYMVAERIARFGYAIGGGFPSHSQMLCCMGLESSLGYLFCLYTLARGGLFCVPDPSFATTVKRISAYEITSAVAPPTVLSDLCNYALSEHKSFRPLELVITAGSSLPKSLADTVRGNICNGMINVYGSAEAGVTATAPVEKLDLDKGEVGFVVPDIEVDTVDTATNEPNKDGGGIRIRGETVAKNYYGPEEDRQAAFKDGAFLPGDYGYLSVGGLLSVFGREGNQVNLGGVKTTLERLEARYAAAPAIREAAAVLIPDHLGINRPKAIIVPNVGWSENAFWDYCHKNLAREFWPIAIVTSDRLPRAPSGKIDRRQLLLAN